MARVTTIPATISRFTATPINEKKKRRTAAYARVSTFDTALWCGLVDFVTVHSKDDVRFTFKNGQEIRA